MNSFKKQAPFFGRTLTELLVVVAIIGILTSIVPVKLTSAQTGARDDIRKTDIKTLQVAIELCKAQNGTCPLPGDSLYNLTVTTLGSESVGGVKSGNKKCSDGTNNHNVGSVPDYIPVISDDPKYSSDLNNLEYVYSSDSKQYKILVYSSAEIKKNRSLLDDLARCPCVTNTCNVPLTDTLIADDYAVYSDGPNSPGW